MASEKAIIWIGSSYSDLLKFPGDVRRQAGFQLSKIQWGLEPDDWKAFDNAGSGLREIRIRELAGEFRIMIVAKFEEALYVLHCFHKTSRATSHRDKDIVSARYRAVLNARRGGK
ncbi:type II toxin-antitoxin system RelE/ParE family toxin [Achromobacter seleniivolatilans]|uniref:Type II toxin-antitoxin system RelE/ParE family toxin n=1 Tax=Achromobacter seleniivolatilans TaxID=3047478 RepID=A0ABY9LW00_9BURK|nr:type II toxin-antitoxin system RelE/ParE family toxin [Achromobacter sp. R39]WMD18655.1 type II toxin-antitoxin system RelE/ParE family toxin [Achromobacter sp. R39]